MIYSFHHFYYWVKGGIETGQAYRAKIFRELGLEAKFVYATTFPDHNVLYETSRLGFLDSEVVWMYGYFTDCLLSPVTYTLDNLENTFGGVGYSFSREDKMVTYNFQNKNRYVVAHLADGGEELVHSVDIISNGCLLRKDYYTYCRIYSEFYAPADGHAILYQRRFYHEDGSVAYEEILDGDSAMYQFPDRILYSREELVGYMMSCLKLTKEDIVLIDAEPGMIDRAAFIQNAYPARVGFIIHGNHCIDSDEEHIFWYDFYEYALSHPDKIDFFITSTDAQSNLLRELLFKYQGVKSKVLTIPVAGLDRIRIPPQDSRKRHSLITAGRFSFWKSTAHIIEAVVIAREYLSDISLDIYGEGEEEQNIQQQIKQLHCEDYVHLCGFQKLDDVYQRYDAYVTASMGETFGVSLLEATGSGLPIVGYDVFYGPQIFIDEGENGYKVPYGDIGALADGIVRLFTEADIEAFRRHSYEKAKGYLTEEIKKKWSDALNLIK